MISNRSVPTNLLLPHLVYADVDEAAAWLSRVFGFTEHYRHGGKPPSGLQMHLGDAWIMLSRAREGRASPAQCGAWTQSLTIFVEDVEQHYGRANAAGATIVEALHETVYGELQYGATDLEGHHWLFSRHAKDVDPADWAAQVAGK